MTTNSEPTRSYDEYLAQKLQNKEFAIAYLNASLEDEEDLQAFLLALRRVVDAQKIPKTGLAQQAGISREKLYTMLSEKGNPEWRSLKAILDSLGYKLTIGA